MQKSIVEPFVFYKKNGQELPGMGVQKVDDSLGIESETFLELEESASKIITTKQKKLMEIGKEMTFNG